MAGFSADDCIAFLERLTLDTDETWRVEDFQRRIIEDIAAGTPEVVVVIPEGNAKTTLMAGVALYVAQAKRMAKIPLAAASRDQAGLLFGQAGDLIRRSGLETEFRIFNGYRKITHLAQGSEIQVFAADDRTGDGQLFDIAFCDELHRLSERTDMRLWRIWRGKLDKRGGQLVGISTAGAPGSTFEEMRERMKTLARPERDEAHLVVRTEDAVLHEWALSDADDLDDFNLVKTANPLSTITAEKLARRHRSPSMTPAHWARFVCNVATVEEGSWLPAGAWDACLDPGAQILDGAPVWLGVDVGLKKDKSAVVLISYAEDERIDVRAKIFDPPGGDERLDLGIVEDYIRELAGRYEVMGCAYDPWNFTRSAQLLEGDGLLMIEHPMTNARMVPASQRLYEAVLAKRLRHDGDPVLAQHIMAGTSQQTERGWRLGKRKARMPQDALIALCLAFGVADIQEDQGAPVLEWIA